MEKQRKTKLEDAIGHSQCVFDSIDTSFGEDYPFLDRYPLMKVWFTVPSERKGFFWIPKWEELYEVLHYAVEVEAKNFPSSSWSELLRALEKVFRKDFRMPRRKHVGSSFRTGEPGKQLTEAERKQLERIRSYQSEEDN